METKTRSAVKSVIWRVWGVLILGAVTWAYTRHWAQTGAITFLHHGVFLFVFWAHERVWLKIKIKGGKRHVLKAFVYEIILGQGILGLISYAVTGSLLCASKITITYILNKLWIYMVYDRFWESIKWGKGQK